MPMLAIGLRACPLRLVRATLALRLGRPAPTQPPRFSSNHQRRVCELFAKYVAESADKRPFVEDDTEVERERI